MLINSNLKFKFKAVELHCFNWLFNSIPCFPINSSKINIITDPHKFYDTLCQRFKNADRRISVASLYVGTGALEKQLLQVTKQNLLSNKSLNLCVLLDYQRGTRGKVNSRTLLQEFVDEVPDRCDVFLYQTPRLRGALSHVVPARYNELAGLQHMKLYIADDSVLLSGANCSNDYFHQRQDRYFEIHDADLANFYSELIGEVNKFSKQCSKAGLKSNELNTKEEIVKEINEKIRSFIKKWQDKQILKLSAAENDSNINTWIFPLLQMGEFNIQQDEKTTQKLIATAPQGSKLRLATGYFNLTKQYANTLLKHCQANTSLLMAHPNANGFLGAPGPAGGIPHAYSLLAKQFLKRVLNSNQSHRIQLLEYERPGWTFHAKGLWYYPRDSSVPWGTVVGSANLGERSVRRDLEAQAAIFTVSPELQEQLHNECEELHSYSSECTSELQKRQTPLWVQATVGLFRTYF